MRARAKNLNRFESMDRWMDDARTGTCRARIEDARWMDRRAMDGMMDGWIGADGGARRGARRGGCEDARRRDV